MNEKEKKEKRDTIGSLSQELLSKEPDTLDPIELQREIQGDSYEEQLLEAVERGKKKYAKDFYLVVLNQKFRLLPNVFRTYFIDRLSCPSPEFDQTVYRYSKTDDAVDFLWCIPDQHTCEEMRLNALQIPPEQRELLGFVLDMYDGTLLNIARKLNKEEEQDLVIENH